MRQHLNINCFKYIIYILTLCVTIILVYKNIHPIYKEESINSSSPTNTLQLAPNDYVLQTFQPTYKNLNTLKIAFCYDEDISAEATANVQIFKNDKLIIEQPLIVSALPNRTFITLWLEQKCNTNDNFTIKVTNTSTEKENEKVSFSLLATDKEYLYLSNTQDYLFNNQTQNSRILCSYTYITGYSYYKALTYAFWGFLLTLALPKIIHKFITLSRQNNVH